MRKLEAVLLIIQQAKATRNSKISLARLQNACKVLGLSAEEIRQVEMVLEYRSEIDGKYYHER